LAAGEFRFGVIAHRRFDRSAAMRGLLSFLEAVPNAGCAAVGVTPGSNLFLERIP